MFEKEAEERTIRVHCNHCWQKDANIEHRCTGLDYCGRHNDWRAGAEFGYNKANEWHFVKDGDFPKEDEHVVVSDGKHWTKAHYKDGKWYTMVLVNLVLDIIMWKEIEIPRLNTAYLTITAKRN